MGEPRRWFFMHMHKAAGTSLFSRMHEEFADECFYPAPVDEPTMRTTLAVDELLGAWRRRREEIRVVTGHFPLCTLELLDAPFTVFTVLRDPVERVMSAVRHIAGPGADAAALEGVYDDPIHNLLIRNHMTKMLSLRVEDMPLGDGVLAGGPITPELTDRAKDRLRGVDLVGTQERFESFCDELSTRYGWNLGDPRRFNRSAPNDVPAGFRRRIEEENRPDAELYELACQLQGARR